MKIRSDIQQRESATIDLHYSGGVVAVPITPASRRRFRLMQDDCIELSFSLAEAIHVGIGDYVTDEIFGRFIVTEEQLPRYNAKTGGYDYTLRFDAEYIGWKNWLFCLATGGKRMESRWNLTDRLDTHVQQIADNVNIAMPELKTQISEAGGQPEYTSNGYGIEVTADNAAEIKHLSYDGTNIIEAMNMIADEWSCEWWVTGDSIKIGNTTYAHTIHFGKCEDSGEAYEMTLADNVETMDVARDQQEYCNRLYAFGGTKNVPEDYDKHLEFTATMNGRTAFRDIYHTLTLSMIDAEASVASEDMVLSLDWTQGGTTAERTYTIISHELQLSGKQVFDIDLSLSVSITNQSFIYADLPVVVLSAKLHYGSNVANIPISFKQIHDSEVLDGWGWFADVTYNKEINLGSSAVNVYLELVWSMRFTATHANDDVEHSENGSATATSGESNKDVTVVFNGVTYNNCVFSGSTGLITFPGTKPSGFNNGSKYTIANLYMPNVPLSWFTSDFDAGSLASLGERRLHLPASAYPNRYIDNIGSTYNSQKIVERVVIFDGIFPELTLRIKDGTLEGETKQQRVDHSDGSVSYEDWEQWSFEAEMLVDRDNDEWEDFPFRDYYILDGNKLQAVFSTPATANATGHLLAGMTFDVGFSNNRYTVIRNNDYGAMLPNDRLVPSELDEFVLTGWNPRYIGDLDMVAIAENRLATKAAEYLNAIKEGQFTITSHMMSDTFTAAPFAATQGNFGLLEAGSRVRVNHGALPGGYKESRIIGYEYKLDIPFDTPTYTIGETEAFSRLRQIEKQLTKL